MSDLPKDYFRIEIVHVQHRPTVRRTWQQMSDTGNAIDKGPTYGYAEEPSVASTERQVLKMETERISVPAVVRAALGYDAASVAHPIISNAE